MAEKKTTYIKGAAILAATVAITKVIGAIYKIPLFNLLGDEGTTHFQVTYTIYNLLLTISTAGIPVALSRLISAARATERPRQVKRYFSVGMMAFCAIGFIGMVLMLLFAQNLARGKEPQTSVITLPGEKVGEWVEAYYRQSEQRLARTFDLGNDRFALITAQPGADHDWLEALTTEDVAALSATEQTKLLETRKFFFRCGCTAEKILPVIRAMKHDFADQLSEQGFIEASCPRCGATYRLTAEMVKGNA